MKRLSAILAVFLFLEAVIIRIAIFLASIFVSMLFIAGIYEVGKSFVGWITRSTKKAKAHQAVA